MRASKFINYSMYYSRLRARLSQFRPSVDEEMLKSVLALSCRGLVAASVVLAVGSAQAKKAPPIDPGPMPTMEEYRALADPAIRAPLMDHDAAKIRFPYGLIKGDNGYYTCAVLNGKNIYGAYTGDQFVTVGVGNGKVQWVEIDGIGTALYIDSGCRDMIRHGKLPLVN